MTDTYSRPFEKYLEEWSALLAKRLAHAHRDVAGQISARILPHGEWRFPAQALLLPQSLAWRQITSAQTSPMSTPLIRRRKTTFEDDREPWTPCGNGWVRPIAKLSASLNRNACQWNLRHTPDPEEPGLFDPEQGLLVCIAAEEEAVALLSRAKQHYGNALKQGEEESGVIWSAQIGGRAYSVQVERYEGYFEMERALRLSAPTTPALETWLPPFYPYSRKILHLRFSTGSTASPFSAYSASEQGLSSSAEPADITLSVTLEGDVGEMLRERLKNGDDWLLLNPVVAAQMQMGWRPTDYHRVMRNKEVDFLEVEFDNLNGVFAAAGVSEETWAAAPFRQDGYKTRVACANNAEEARVYFGSRGEIAPAEFDSADPTDYRKRREILDDPDNEFNTRTLDFAISLFPLGGVTLDFSNPIGDACRFWWQWMFLRSRMLTFGELQEFLRHLPDCKRCFDISRARFRLEGVNTRLQEPTLWDSYLWPSRMAEPFLSYQPAFRPPASPEESGMAEEGREPEQPAPSLPISPVMRLTLPVKAGVVLPDYLLKDMVHHAASCLEQNFSLGWYRIVGEIER